MSHTMEHPGATNRDFARRKLFSFLGLAPMAVYVVVHLATHGLSHMGGPAWERRLNDWHDNPFYWPVVIAFIYLPFTFHTIYGLVLASRGRPTGSGGITSFSYIKYLLQRISAVGILLFLGAHVFKTRIEPAMNGERLDFQHMVEAFHHVPTILVYALGTLGVAFHLANGLWLAAITWGVTVSRSSQRSWQSWSIAAFLAIAIMGFVAMWGFGRVPYVAHPGQAAIGY